MYDLKKCPYCSEDIDTDSVQCPNCGQWLPIDDGTPLPDTPLLEQNYPMGRFLALALFIVTIFTNGFTLHLIKLDSEAALLLSDIITLAISSWLFYFFMQYLLNFGLYDTRRYVAWIIATNIVVTLFSTFTGFRGGGFLFTTVSVVIVFFSSILYLVAIFRTANTLCRFTRDRVGGLRRLGMILRAVLILSLFPLFMVFPFAFLVVGNGSSLQVLAHIVVAVNNILVAVGMYGVFTKAEIYQNREDE